MTDTLQMQLALSLTPEAILKAWTDDLAVWFAEFADISIADKRYDFWGRYTPETPTRESGHHPLTAYDEGRGLTFGWTLDSQERTIRVEVQPRDEQHSRWSFLR
jgi:hypothetical protein